MYLGPAVTKPQNVLKIGDVIYVEPVGDKGSYGLRQVPQINGAIVSMDPHTGRVLAMSGGFSYKSSQFDRAMQAMRQPGSRSSHSYMLRRLIMDSRLRARWLMALSWSIRALGSVFGTPRISSTNFSGR